jgi:hypothetical protein
VDTQQQTEVLLQEFRAAQQARTSEVLAPRHLRAAGERANRPGMRPVALRAEAELGARAAS